MNVFLKLGAVALRLICPEKTTIEESIIPFLCTDVSAHWDVMIEFSQDFSCAPNPAGRIAGEDLLLRYYCGAGKCICEAKGGPKGPLAISVCGEDAASWTCYLNIGVYDLPLSVGNLIRLVPMPMILLYQDAVLLHASQIAVNGTGILFTAPSGTGKSTQARLWRDHRGARIICNDRALLRGGDAHGYPLDGSDPVYSSDHYPIGAIVLLGQAPSNQIYRLKPSAAMAKLMPQTVFPSWDAESKSRIYVQLLDLISRYPVYQFNCTPDETAVACLEKQLIMDGVI